MDKHLLCWQENNGLHETKVRFSEEDSKNGLYQCVSGRGINISRTQTQELKLSQIYQRLVSLCVVRVLGQVGVQSVLECRNDAGMLPQET